MRQILILIICSVLVGLIHPVAFAQTVSDSDCDATPPETCDPILEENSPPLNESPTIRCYEPDDTFGNPYTHAISNVAMWGYITPTPNDSDPSQCPQFRPNDAIRLDEAAKAVCRAGRLSYSYMDGPCDITTTGDYEYAYCMNALYGERILKTYTDKPYPDICPDPSRTIPVYKMYDMVTHARIKMGYYYLDGPVAINWYSLYKKIVIPQFYNGPKLAGLANHMSWGLTDASIQVIHGLNCGHLPGLDPTTDPTKRTFGNSVLKRDLAAAIISAGMMEMTKGCVEEISDKFRAMGMKANLVESFHDFLLYDYYDPIYDESF